MFLPKTFFNKVLAAKYSTSSIFSTAAKSFSGYYNHRNTENNVNEAPFEFTDENYIEIKRILKKFPSNYKQSAIISV